MVAMDMGDEDRLYLVEIDTRTAYLELGALTAIHHELLVAQFHHLRGSHVVQGGKCTTAT